MQGDGGKESGGKKKETPAELKKKARDRYAPFVNESVNVLLDMGTLGSSLRSSNRSLSKAAPDRGRKDRKAERAVGGRSISR